MIFDCSTHSRLRYPNVLTIWSFMFTCIKLLFGVHNNRHLFLCGFVTLWSNRYEFSWDQKHVSIIRSGKFHLNPLNLFQLNRPFCSTFNIQRTECISLGMNSAILIDALDDRTRFGPNYWFVTKAHRDQPAIIIFAFITMAGIIADISLAFL